MNEIHPHADLSVDAFGAIDGGDIRVTDAREQPPLFESPWTHARGHRVPDRNDLQRHFAIEAPIPGARHVAKGATAKHVR